MSEPEDVSKMRGEYNRLRVHVAALEVELADARGGRDGAKLRAELAEEVALSLLKPSATLVKMMGSVAYNSPLLDETHRELRKAFESDDAKMLLQRLTSQGSRT